MIIKMNDKFLVLRYGNIKGINCIEEHIKVLTEKGFVWFGKIGGNLNKNFLEYIKNKDENEKKYVILVSRDESYLCEYCEVSTTIENKEGIPKYYYEKLLNNNINFSVLFKIIKVKKINKADLDKFVIASSRNNLVNALRGSMAAHFFVKSLKDITF